MPSKQQQLKNQSSYTNIRHIKLKTKKVTRVKKRNVIMIKGSIHQDSITVINIDTTQPQQMNQKLTELKGEIDDVIITFGIFNNTIFNK